MALTRAGSDLTLLHGQQQRRLAAEIERIVRASWPLLDPDRLDETVSLWMRALLPVIEAGWRNSAGLAATYLQAFALAETGAEAVVASIPAAPVKAAETSLRVTGPITVKVLTESGMNVAAATSSALGAVIGSAQRHVRDGGRTMITDTVAADPQVPGWRRVGSGDCKFCRMLMERGAVYTETSARFASHDHCNCEAEPAYGGGPRASVEQYTASKRTITEADRARVRNYLAQMD